MLEKNVVGSNHDVQYGCQVRDQLATLPHSRGAQLVQHADDLMMIHTSLQTSIVSTEDEFKEWVETDDCVNLCGLERMSVGLSSDVVVEEATMASLCSASCQDNCPNVIDLYSKLAAGEGDHTSSAFLLGRKVAYISSVHSCYLFCVVLGQAYPCVDCATSCTQA